MHTDRIPTHVCVRHATSSDTMAPTLHNGWRMKRDRCEASRHIPAPLDNAIRYAPVLLDRGFPVDVNDVVDCDSIGDPGADTLATTTEEEATPPTTTGSAQSVGAGAGAGADQRLPEYAPGGASLFTAGAARGVLSASTDKAAPTSQSQRGTGRGEYERAREHEHEQGSGNRINNAHRDSSRSSPARRRIQQDTRSGQLPARLNPTALFASSASHAAAATTAAAASTAVAPSSASLLNYHTPSLDAGVAADAAPPRHDPSLLGSGAILPTRGRKGGGGSRGGGGGGGESDMRRRVLARQQAEAAASPQFLASVVATPPLGAASPTLESVLAARVDTDEAEADLMRLLQRRLEARLTRL